MSPAIDLSAIPTTRPVAIRDRRLWYCPSIDPKADTSEMDSYEVDDLYEPTADRPANVIGSKCWDGLHRPALDIDIPCAIYPGGRVLFNDLDTLPARRWPAPVADLLGSRCRLVPSSTEGHHHLYADHVALPWDEYLTLLDGLTLVGIIEHGYFDVSEARGMTCLRLPGTAKVAPHG